MTTPTLVPTQLLTTAMIAMLARSINEGGIGRKVYDHRFKGKEPPFPYAVVKHVGGVALDGPAFTAPDADVAVHFQVDSVGTRRDQAQLLGDAVREVILGRLATGSFKSALAISGWVVCDRLPLSALGGVEVNGTPPNEIYVVPQQYALHVTPA